MNQYLIWSNEKGRWWAPARCGYTSVIGEAGRYSRAEAEQICADANRYRPEGAQPHEVMLLAPETDRLAALENERNVSMGVGDGSGQRFVYGTYEAIKAAQAIVLRKEALEAENQQLKAAWGELSNAVLATQDRLYRSGPDWTNVAGEFVWVSVIEEYAGIIAQHREALAAGMNNEATAV